MYIRPYSTNDQSVVVDLWRRCNLARPQNDSTRDIERKLGVNPELFLVGVLDGKVVGTVMAGYEGHRGWINYLGVDPACRRRGLGRQLIQAAEARLLNLGCPKINLQVRSDNIGALEFYRKIGYSKDEVISLGKRLVSDHVQQDGR